MRDLRADGSSASPTPDEVFTIQFCDRFGLSWEEYYRMPKDRIRIMSHVAGMVDGRMAKLRAAADSGSGNKRTYFLDDGE